jgi:hypothetical protein
MQLGGGKEGRTIMNPLIQLKTTILLPLIVVVGVCFALAPVAEGVPPRRGEDRGNGNSAAENVDALNLGTTGSDNTAHGWFSLFSNTTGSTNTADGFQALYSNTDGGSNTANGFQALFSNTFGSQNTADGFQALHSNTTGIQNTANGVQALNLNTTGFRNTANGFRALNLNTTGAENTANGFQALNNNTTGDNNTALGTGAGLDITGSGYVCIGQGVAGEAGVDDSTYIRNVNTLTQNFSPGINDYVTVRLTDGRLGHTAVVSSQRYKQDIKPLAAASQALHALKPVSFRLKKEFDPTQALGFGLIAEEVEKVNPALVYRNTKGQAESVRYEMVNAMLLNEFLKEHRKVQEQEATIARLTSTDAKQEAMIANQQKQIKALTAGLQKVSAQVEMNERASQTVAER